MLNVIQIVVESLSIMLFGYVLLNKKWQWGSWLFYSLIFALIVWLARMLPMAYGVHSLIAMLVLGLMLKHITQKPLTKTMTTAVIIMVLLIIFETTTLDVFRVITNIEFNKLVNNEKLWFLLGLPHSITLCLLAIYIKAKKPKVLNKIGLDN